MKKIQMLTTFFFWLSSKVSLLKGNSTHVSLFIQEERSRYTCCTKKFKQSCSYSIMDEK